MARFAALKTMSDSASPSKQDEKLDEGDAASRTGQPDALQEKSDWTRRLAESRRGLAALSFAESTVVPIPLETVVVPLMVGHPRRAMTIAIAIWIGCLAGASLFFWGGYLLAEPVVRPALDALGLLADFESLIDRMDRSGLFWTVFLISFSPAPMQLATLGAGVAKGNFLFFLAAIALSRGVRYFGLAFLAQIFGERIARYNIPKRKLVPAIFVAMALVWGISRLF